MRLIFSASVCSLSCVLLSGCALTSTATDSGTEQGAAIHGVSMGGRAPISGQKVYLLEAVTTGYISNYAQSSLGSGFSNPFGVAVDSSENVYVGDYSHNAVKEITAASGYTTVNTLGGGFHSPSGVAVDKNGNVYVADTSNNAMKEIPLSCINGVNNSSCVVTLGSGFSSPEGVAVDSSENVFVADSSNSLVKEIPLSCITGSNNSSCVATLGSSFSFNSPRGIALDGSGNVFIGDYGANMVYEILKSGGYTTVATLGNTFYGPFGVGLDGSGNVYVAASDDGKVYEILKSGGYTTVNTAVSGINNPWGVAFDGYGNLYVSGSAGNAVYKETVSYTHQASKSLLTSATGHTDSIGHYVLSDANGNWSISGDYTCDTGAQVYLYGLGGNSGAGGVNTGIGLMAALGQCPSSSPYNFATADPFVTMNEVTTVAAAYAMAGYATDVTHVSSNSTTLAKQGIANAFANAGSLATISSGTANSSVPNVSNSSVPQQEINTLANILAACVNSLTGSANCTKLFTDAESAGPTGTAPTDTATAAINIAHNPGTVNVSDLFTLQAGIGSAPYPTDLSGAPNDFTVRLAFTGGGLTATTFEPQGLAIDGSGNVWVDTGNANVLVEFNPLGVPVSSTGFTGLGLNGPNSVAIDAASANVWIANFNGSSVTDFNIGNATAVNYTTGINGPGSAQLDGSGNVWVTNGNNSTAVKLNGSTGAVLATASNNGLGQSQSLSIEPGAAGNVWFVYGSSQASIFTDAGVAVGVDTAGGINAANGCAIDAGGFVWIANNANNVSKLDSGGVTGSSFSLPTGTVQVSVAIDGASNAWFTSQSGVAETIFEFSNAGTNLSGTNGFVAVSGAVPGSIGIDGSGNVWYTDDANPTLYELVGAATPVVTPIAYGVANSKLGTVP